MALRSEMSSPTRASNRSCIAGEKSTMSLIENCSAPSVAGANTGLIMVPILLSQERLIPAPRVAVVGEVLLAHGQRTNQATGFACIYSLRLFCSILMKLNFTEHASPNRYERRYGRR